MQRDYTTQLNNVMTIHHAQWAKNSEGQNVVQAGEDGQIQSWNCVLGWDSQRPRSVGVGTSFSPFSILRTSCMVGRLSQPYSVHTSPISTHLLITSGCDSSHNGGSSKFFVCPSWNTSQACQENNFNLLDRGQNPTCMPTKITRLVRFHFSTLSGSITQEGKL
jgi:hypothetical protein